MARVGMPAPLQTIRRVEIGDLSVVFKIYRPAAPPSAGKTNYRKAPIWLTICPQFLTTAKSKLRSISIQTVLAIKPCINFICVSAFFRRTQRRADCWLQSNTENFRLIKGNDNYAPNFRRTFNHSCSSWRITGEQMLGSPDHRISGSSRSQPRLTRLFLA